MPILTAAQRRIDTPFHALVPHIKERSTFRGCLEAHLFGLLDQELQVVKTILAHDPEPFGDIKNNVGVLSRYLVKRTPILDWSPLIKLLLEQGLGLEDNMGILDPLWGVVVPYYSLDSQGTTFEITSWLVKRLRDEGPGLLTLELCNAVMRLLQLPPKEVGDRDLNKNDSQSSQGNDNSESDRQQKNNEVDHKNNKRKRLEEEDRSSDEEEGKDETDQVEDKSKYNRQRDIKIGHINKKRNMLVAPSSDEKERNNKTSQVQDDSESDRQEEESQAGHNNDESPRSEGRSSDQEEDYDSNDQGNDDSELDWDEIRITTSDTYPAYDYRATTVDRETIKRLKELRARIFHQIYG